MIDDVLASHFLALWRRALNLPSHGDLTPQLIREWATQRGIVVEDVEERDVGTFGTTRSVVLTTPEGCACFPKIPEAGDSIWEARHAAAERRAELWKKVEWFEPLWVPRGRVEELLKDIRACSKKQAIDRFSYHTSTIYTLPFLAVCISQLIPQGRSLQDFCPLVCEAFLGFYSGYRASSIAALIPVMEGALTRILVNPTAKNLTTSDKVNEAVNGAIAHAKSIHWEYLWVPREYNTVEYLIGQDERVLVFETFRRWLHDSFYSNTDDYDGVTWLNRHLFAHGVSSSWQQSANFERLVVALATLGVVQSWHDNTGAVSIFFPEMNDDSRLLWQRALLQVQVQYHLNSVAEKRYHEHGRLVPELPTDNGALHRRALLSDDCINDLVRPLRNAGWSVEVGESEDDGLYITVSAESNGHHLNVALLYSCATANETYKRLAETNDLILYRGAPYHQDQYAYGLDVHVGPVTGWQPPAVP